MTARAVINSDSIWATSVRYAIWSQRCKAGHLHVVTVVLTILAPTNRSHAGAFCAQNHHTPPDGVSREACAEATHSAERPIHDK